MVFWNKNKKNILFIICSDFLGFIAAKFNILLNFLSSLYKIKIKIQTVCFETTFMQYFNQTYLHVHINLFQACGKNKLTQGKTKL